MKKLLFASLVLLGFTLQAQQFELSPNGFVDSENKENNYIVLEYPDKSQEELFNDVLIFITKNFKSAKDVISKVEYSTITINAYSDVVVRRNMLHEFKNNYTIVFLFKDGKIKIEAPIVNLYTYTNNIKQQLHIYYPGSSFPGEHFSIYKKNGNPRSQRAIDDLNKFANVFMNLFKEEMDKLYDNNNNDW